MTWQQCLHALDVVTRMDFVLFADVLKGNKGHEELEQALKEAQLKISDRFCSNQLSKTKKLLNSLELQLRRNFESVKF